MGSPKPTLGYPSRTAAIEGLRKEQLSTRAIANRLGIPVKDVRALEGSKHRTRARRAELRARRAEVAAAERSKPASARQISIEIDMDLRQALRPHAIRHEMTVEGLARRILDTVAYDDKVDAVLQVEKGDW